LNVLSRAWADQIDPFLSSATICTHVSDTILGFFT
jgi:hypothetical protein